MVATRIAVLCGCGLALGGCLSPMTQTASYASLPSMTVTSGAMPPVVEPGQLLRPNLGRVSAGVNPSEDLRSSERARVAWAPLDPYHGALPPSVAAQATHFSGGTGAIGSADAVGPSKVARGGADREAKPSSYDREATMDRLEKEGRKDAEPICGGC
jgi:hypothetical protein